MLKTNKLHNIFYRKGISDHLENHNMRVVYRTYSHYGAKEGPTKRAALIIALRALRFVLWERKAPAIHRKLRDRVPCHH